MNKPLLIFLLSLQIVSCHRSSVSKSEIKTQDSNKITAQSSPSGVQLADETWHDWWEAVKLGKSSEIIKFNNYNLILGLTTRVPNVFVKEMRSSAEMDREPFYLEAFSRLNEEQIKIFLKKKEKNLKNKKEWQRHAKYVLNTMGGYFGTIAMSSSFALACLASENKDDFESVTTENMRDYALSRVTILNYETLEAEAVVEGTKTTTSTKMHDLDVEVDSFHIDFFNMSVNLLAEPYKIYDRLKTLSEFELKNVLSESKDHKSRLVYRVVEKEVLVELLRGRSLLLEDIYAKVVKVQTPYQKKIMKIFKDQDSWKLFKEKWLENLNPDEAHFLKPWLVELDRIVREIAEH